MRRQKVSTLNSIHPDHMDQMTAPAGHVVISILNQHGVGGTVVVPGDFFDSYWVLVLTPSYSTQKSRVFSQFKNYLEKPNVRDAELLTLATYSALCRSAPDTPRVVSDIIRGCGSARITVVIDASKKTLIGTVTENVPEVDMLTNNLKAVLTEELHS